jgi:dUTP pyrophosphatase
MIISKVKVKQLDERAHLPYYASAGAAGADLFAFCPEADIVIAPNETVKVPTGIALEFTSEMVALIFARSGLATKQGLAPANKVGVVDSDYRGEIMVVLYNQSNEPRTIHHGDRIAQLIMTPVVRALFEEVNELDVTLRGDNGFGSTGTRIIN